MDGSIGTLAFTTWLTPGLPRGQYETIARHVSRGLDRPYHLDAEPRFSGPVNPDDDRFARGSTDIGFVCPTSYLWLVGRTPPSVVLVPVTPVRRDERGEGEPVYFSDVVVRSDSGITSFDDLAGRQVGFNDRSSLSGYFSMLLRLDADKRDEEFFADFKPIGSHRRALAAILDGELDAAAIDSNVWAEWRNENREDADRLRSAAALGPFPAQPVVVRAELAEELVEPVTDLLLQPELIEALRPFGVTDLAPVAPAAYADLDRRLARLSHRLAQPPG